jgi:DNA-binding beta-propeller fold protein YncE
MTSRPAYATACWAFCAFACLTAYGEPSYQVTRRIPASTARWDYAAVDTKAHRLYVGRTGGVLSVDLQKGTVATVAPSALVHGVLPIADSDVVMSTNGEADTVTVFKGSSGQVVATIKVGKEPDAIILEPRTGLVVVTNEESHDLTLIDPVKRAVVGRIDLPGKPEYPAANGRGSVYDNIEDRNEIAEVDIANRKVVRTLALTGCDRPTGLAYDGLDDLLISVCHNGVAKFVDAKTGRIQATIEIGKVPDAVLFDATRRLIFIPCGDPGVLSVIAVRSASDIRLVQSLTTQAGSRTGALDPDTGDIYLPAGRFSAPVRAGGYPEIVAGSFSVLVVAATAGATSTEQGQHRQ